MDGEVPLFLKQALEEPFYAPATVKSVFFDEERNDTFIEVADDNGLVLQTKIPSDCILQIGTPVMIKKAGLALYSSTETPPSYSIHYEMAGESVFLVATSESREWGAFLVDPIITRSGKRKVELVDVRQKGKDETKTTSNITIKSHLMALASDACLNCPAFKLCGPANVGLYEVERDEY